MKTQRLWNRLPANAEGKFFTTSECDGCAYCASVGAEYFDYEKKTNTYFVCRQPVNPEEEEVVLEAKDDCPLDAIHTLEELEHIE
jgi:ferredoxin